MTADERLAAAASVVSGLQAVHAAGFIHFDVKSSNVLMVDERGSRCVLADLGVAIPGPSVHYAAPDTKESVDYPYYAPEYVKAGKISYASDVYCTGLLFLELLTGKLLHTASGGFRQFVSRFQAMPESVEFFDGAAGWGMGAQAGFARLVARCLAEDPEMRPPLVDLQEGLDRLRAGGVETPAQFS